MQAIQTRYLGPTNTRGARIKAWCQAGKLIIGFPYGSFDPHADAANALFAQLGWGVEGDLTGGTLPCGDHCFVITPTA